MNRRKQRAFDACLAARNEAQQQLRSTAEQLERQQAENTTVYGMNMRLARVQLEKDKELKELGDECQVLRATSESLEHQIAKLRAQLAEYRQGERAHSEEIQRLVGERDARLALKDEQIARLESERDTSVFELDQMKHAVVNKLVDQSDETFDQVRELEARYAHFARDMDDKAAQIARENEAKLAELAREKETKAAELDRDKDAFILKLRKQRDQYKEMANSLGDRRLPAASPSTRIQFFESPSTETPTPPTTTTTTTKTTKTTSPLLPPQLDEDELQFHSLD